MIVNQPVPHLRKPMRREQLCQEEQERRGNERYAGGRDAVQVVPVSADAAQSARGSHRRDLSVGKLSVALMQLVAHSSQARLIPVWLGALLARIQTNSLGRSPLRHRVLAGGAIDAVGCVGVGVLAHRARDARPKCAE